MSVLNAKGLADYISNWIKDYATKAGVKCGVLGLSGGVDSALVALLWKRTGLPLLCVNLPCHSSSSANERAKNFAVEYDLQFRTIDLSAAHDALYNQLKETNFPVDGMMNNPIAVGGMRSTLRPSALNFLTNVHHGIIVGTGNRSEDHITRYFQKFGDGNIDISPIADLFKSEVYQLFSYLATYVLSPQAIQNQSDWAVGKATICLDISIPSSARAIYDAKPTADLWGPDGGQEDEKELGISYDEIEWADRVDMNTHIIFNDADPAKSEDFYRYTGRQQQVLAKLHAMEKASRHKMNPNLPVCEVRNIEGLVR